MRTMSQKPLTAFPFLTPCVARCTARGFSPRMPSMSFGCALRTSVEAMWWLGLLPTVLPRVQWRPAGGVAAMPVQPDPDVGPLVRAEAGVRGPR